MATEKLIIGAYEMIKVLVYRYKCKCKRRQAKGKKRYLGDKRAGFTYDELGRQVPDKQIIVGKYHVKNYKQCNKKRRNIIRELICNNFQHRKCMMITVDCQVILTPFLLGFYNEVDRFWLKFEFYMLVGKGLPDKPKWV
ncbi:MAG: hypothetical protein QME45_05215 [Clostridiales bacterium]|nr:hypothetical protein [Clostridiales bacterium]